jgi:hypothetical protein
MNISKYIKLTYNFFLSESLAMLPFGELSEQNVNFNIAATISAIDIDFESSSPCVKVLQHVSEFALYWHVAQQPIPKLGFGISSSGKSTIPALCT